MSQVAPAQHYCRRGKAGADAHKRDSGSDADSRAEVLVLHPRAETWRPPGSGRSQDALPLKDARCARPVSRPERSGSPGKSARDARTAT